MSKILRAEFVKAFDAALETLAQAERVTKEQLRVLSRDLLGALIGNADYDEHLIGDAQFVNRLLTVLTPMNKKTAILYFKEFTGFHFDEEVNQFTKKIQKGKDKHAEKVARFLEDPLNNIWSWADKHVKVEKKPFSMDSVTKIIEKAREETDGDDAAVIRAVFEGGISIESVLLVLSEMGKVDTENPAQNSDDNVIDVEARVVEEQQQIAPV